MGHLFFEGVVASNLCQRHNEGMVVSIIQQAICRLEPYSRVNRGEASSRLKRYLCALLNLHYQFDRQPDGALV